MFINATNDNDKDVLITINLEKISGWKPMGEDRFEGPTRLYVTGDSKDFYQIKESAHWLDSLVHDCFLTDVD